MELSHVNAGGKAEMVDVSGKEPTTRVASASARVLLTPHLISLIEKNEIQKGDVFATARIAGISAAKKTSELIPLCHNIFISSVAIEFTVEKEKSSVLIVSTAKTNAVTGIEMEALTAVTVAALTIYDMCKAVEKSIGITEIRLLSKSGGKSGDYRANT